jgi:hypothetical protein
VNDAVIGKINAGQHLLLAAAAPRADLLTIGVAQPDCSTGN